MANTYSQVFLHIIFAVKNRDAIIPPTELARVHTYIIGTLRQQGHMPYAAGGTGDHVHLLIGYNITQPIPDMVRDIKSSTSRFINQNRLTPGRFEWQAGYGCFSHSKSQTDSVCRYIRNQNMHHKSISLEDEIKHILDRFGVEYDQRYIIRDP